jgi:predicted hydrolase (HD superfamily)
MQNKVSPAFRSQGESMLTDDARALLHEWVQSESLRKHCEAVCAGMRHVAPKQGADAELWGAVALLHDMDFERHPDMPTNGALLTDISNAILAGKADSVTLPGHPFFGVAYLWEHGWGHEVCRAVLSHADYSGIEPVSPMEKTLYAVDELSGFATAVALVRPSKSIHEVDVKSVRKKMKDKAFAAKVSREDIVRGAEQLGVPLDDLIAEVIVALRAEARRLGIEGRT